MKNMITLPDARWRDFGLKKGPIIKGAVKAVRRVRPKYKFEEY